MTTSPHASRENGSVVVLVALSLLGFALVLAMLLDTGEQVARKIEVQNAADAHALSQAQWAARSLNAISMNQVAIAQTLSIAVAAEALQALTGEAAPVVARVTERLAAQAQLACAAGPIPCALATEELARYELYVAGGFARIQWELVPALRMGSLAAAFSRMNDGIVAEFPGLGASLQAELARANGVDEPRFYPSAGTPAGSPLPLERVPLALPELCEAGASGAFGSERENFQAHGYEGRGPWAHARADASRRLTSGSFDPRRAGPLRHSRLGVWARLPENLYAREAQSEEDNEFTRKYANLWWLRCETASAPGHFAGRVHLYRVPGREIVKGQPSRALRDRLSLLAFARRAAGGSTLRTHWPLASPDVHANAQAEIYNASWRVQRDVVEGGVLTSQIEPYGHYDLFSQGWRARLVPSTLLARDPNGVARAVRDYPDLSASLRVLSGRDLEVLHGY